MENMDNPAGIKDLVKTWAPRGVIDIEKLLNEGTEVSVWNRVHGKGTTIKMFIVFISDMCNAFNVFTPMNEHQILELAEDMATELWFIKFEEVAAFFESIKKGYLGKITNRIDAPLIWTIWDQYAEKRMEVIEVRRNSQIFRDPGTGKDAETIREGKIERLGDAFGKIKEHLKEK